MATTVPHRDAASGDRGRGPLRRALHRLVASEAELEGEDLQEQARDVGATPVRGCSERGKVCVMGSVRSTQVDCRGGSPVFEVELYDGTGTATLVFLGRKRVPGIEPGRTVTARGRLTTLEGRRVIFNPAYELLAPSSH
ncbi:MAG TPA: OB-fold nucleic acid binding domain-containing protein [Mycobacteriales bacterium]|nr:OB-fold nucleic acid binding domain-containing protein [Mycobacteriales bacterium]